MYPERLTQLREWLETNGYAGLLIPQRDAFLNTDVSPSEERLAWISGFNGSAGFLIVTPHQAALFTDCRYSVYARQNMDAQTFDVFDTAKKCPIEWLETHVKKGGTIGFDPWLYSFQQQKNLLEKLKNTNLSLKPTAKNPIDLLWKNRPPSPCKKVISYPLTSSGETSRSKRQKLTQDSSPESCFLITSGETLCWLLNVRGEDSASTPRVQGYALIESSGNAHLFVDLQKITPDLQHALGDDVSIKDIQKLRTLLPPLWVQKKVFLDPQETPSALIEMIESSGGTWVAQPNPCILPKALKNTIELTQIRSGHEADGIALVRLLHWLETNPHIGEWDVAEQLRVFKRQSPLYWGDSFPSIVGSGKNGAFIHYKPAPHNQDLLSSSSLLLMDTGSQYKNGATTDVTRTICLGTPFPEHKNMYTRVLRGHIALARAIFPAGTSGSHLDALARLPLWEIGMDYGHGTGHGVGSFLNVHEGPQSFSQRQDKVALQAGMVITIEPGYYRTDSFGIRLENMMVVTEKFQGEDERPFLGFEPLTLVPFARPLICPSELTKTDHTWLNTYHQWVFETLAPYLDEPVRTWLFDHTQPIDRIDFHA